MENLIYDCEAVNEINRCFKKQLDDALFFQEREQKLNRKLKDKEFLKNKILEVISIKENPQKPTKIK